MVDLFFKTASQMAILGSTPNLGQQQDLKRLIEALCHTDPQGRQALMADDFCHRISMAGARVLVERHARPGSMTEVFVSFPMGEGADGFLKLYRWRGAGNHFQMGVGTSEDGAFVLSRITEKDLWVAADTLFKGMVPPVARKAKA